MDFYQIATGDWKVLIMMIIAFVLLYLAIVKKFEPLLLLPIAFGMLITNLPGAEMYHEILFAGGHVNWEIFGGQPITQEFMNHLGELGVSEAVQGTVSVGHDDHHDQDLPVPRGDLIEAGRLNKIHDSFHLIFLPASRP